MTIAKLVLDQAGRVVIIDDQLVAVSGAATIAAQAYDSTYQALWASTGTVDASDKINNGLRFTTAGALRVYDATAGLPATVNTHLGMAMTTDGQVCTTSEASTAPYVLNGVAMTDDGRVYVDILSFALEFADLGAGVVDTTEAIGGATPTFTRATAATTVLSTGLIGAVASGDPRSYYDPTTLEYLGYLAEGARTNICLQSEDVATTWTNTNSTESANAALAPDGATTADKVIPDAAATDGGILQTGLTLTADATYTLSVFAKTSGFDSLQLQLGDVGFANSVAVTYNTTTGAVESAAAVAGTWTVPISSAKQYPNGWWRFTVKAVATTNAGDRVALTCTDTGDGANGVLLWGMQIEAGAFASSYIPTTTAAVARNADVLTYPTTGWLGVEIGSLYVEARTLNTIANNYAVTISDGTTNNRISHRVSSSNIGCVVVAGGAQATLQTSAAVDTAYKIAGAYATNDIACSINGAAVLTDTSQVSPVAMTTMQVGMFFDSSTQFYGPIRRVLYYANRMPNAVLQALTNGSR